MRAVPVPAELVSDGQALAVIASLVGQQLGLRAAFRALTTLDVRLLDHPAAHTVCMELAALRTAGAVLRRGGPRGVTGRGLTQTMRAANEAWRDLTWRVPEGVEAGLAVAERPSPEAVWAFLDTDEAIPLEARDAPPLWRPPVLPEDRDTESLLATLSHAALRETANRTTRMRDGSLHALREACAQALNVPAEVVEQAREGTGTGQLLLRWILDEGGRLPLARIPRRWGRPLQDGLTRTDSALAALQRLGLVFVGVGAVSGVLEVVMPASVVDVLADHGPPMDVRLPGVEIEISVLGTHPPIWRRVQLRGDASLADLHFAIQDALAWDGSHLFEFYTADLARTPLGGLPTSETLGVEVKDAWTVSMRSVLRVPGDTLTYLYDFGDDWEHQVRLTRILPRPLRHRRQLVAGARAAPIEGSGGPEGHARCVALYNGWREAPERAKQLGDWDPEHFDLMMAKQGFDG